MNITFKKKLINYIQLTVSVFLAAIVFNLFFFPLKIVTGGMNGIAIILERLFSVNPTVIIFLAYFICLVIGFICLGKEGIAKTIYGSILYPVAVYLTANITNYITIDYSNLLLVFVVGSVLSGIASGLVYRTGYTTGGVDIIRKILNKFHGISMGRAGFIFNGVIVVAGGAIFGWTKVLYAILILYISSLVTDKIVLGISSSKAFYISTNYVDEVEKYIMESLGHGVTIIDAEGGYSKTRQKMLMCVIPTKDYFKLKEGLELIDKDIFFVVTDSYESMGGR